MGIRNRTSIGTLREQRKSAENLPQAEAVKAKAPVASRARLQSQAQSLQPLAPGVSSHKAPGEKSEHLLERLRTVLKNERPLDESASDLSVIQDELARISQHHQSARAESAREILELEAPKRHFETSSPFRYVVINGGKNEKDGDFPLIPKLDRAPSNFDIYTRDLPKDPAPRFMPLTLLISEDDSRSKTVAPADPSQEAASFTQSKVTYPVSVNKGSVLPKSLVLSLLDDK